jgi:hypothetical protein
MPSQSMNDQEPAAEANAAANIDDVNAPATAPEPTSAGASTHQHHHDAEVSDAPAEAAEPATPATAVSSFTAEQEAHIHAQAASRISKAVISQTRASEPGIGRCTCRRCA